MKELICTNQKELDAAVKEKDAYIIIRDTTEWVRACGNSTVRAYGNSTVRAYDNSTVRAYDNSTVIACDNSTVRVFSPDATILNALMFAVIIMIGCICKIKKKQKSVTVIKNKIVQYSKKDFIDIYGTDKDGNLTLYKSVREDNTDFHTGKIKYEETVICPDWDKDATRQCGGGLHLSPLPELALSYNQGKLLKCKVHKNDFVVFGSDITKVRCRRVTVIGEYQAEASK